MLLPILWHPLSQCDFPAAQKNIDKEHKKALEKAYKLVAIVLAIVNVFLLFDNMITGMTLEKECSAGGG